MFVTKRNGQREPLDMSKYERQIDWCCEGLEGVSAKRLKVESRRPLYDGIPTKELSRNIIVTAADFITLEQPNWTFVAARGVLQELYKVAGDNISYTPLSDFLSLGVKEGRISPELIDPDMFDLDALNESIERSRDLLFDYIGIQTLSDRYLLRTRNGDIFEMPQHLMMRVSMGVARDEQTRDSRTKAALNYYSTLSQLRALPSTPTLFNSGTTTPQLSSCFGSQMGDSLDDIMGTLTEIAHYSKMAGGVAIDVGSIRGKGSYIKSTGGKAGGPVPYINTYDSLLRGFDQSGKRKGSGSFYIENWHCDTEEYLKLRDVGGDPRLRAHDSFPAFMISDLFMERVETGEYWSLFCPNDAPTLHASHGEKFREAYKDAEARGLSRSVVPADELWNKNLTKLFQHGVFWPCFKDTINARYAQAKSGIVNNSNLCTEITLRNNTTQSFVCNLSSVNISKFLLVWDKTTRKLEWCEDLSNAVMTMVKFLDSVITKGNIPHAKGRSFQDEDRAVGLGIMGWAVALSKLGIPYESEEHVHFSNELYKQISIAATYASAKLAEERGSYPKFAESTWAEGKLIQDTMQQRHLDAMHYLGLDLETTNCPYVTFDGLREMVKKGMRNSCLLAIAPTATIANIAGTTACTELPWDLQSRKGNLGGEFNVFAHNVLNNPFNLEMKAARDIDHRWTVRAAAARQIWIDQSQSTNFFLNPNKMSADEIGEYLDDLYLMSWKWGLKTTYYVYSQSAEVTPVTVSSPGPQSEFKQGEAEGPACFLRPGDPGFEDCEACQ